MPGPGGAVAWLVMTVVAVLAVSGCGPSASATPQEDGRPATATDLPGRWVPAEGGGNGRAFVEFAADGGWVGSDGCNGQRGTWAVEQDGGFHGTAGPSTRMFCDNVHVEMWIAGAARVRIVDGALELLDPAGAATGRLVRPAS